MNHKYFYCCIVIVLCQQCYAQEGGYALYKKLYYPEKRWVVTHPFIARKAFRITIHAIAVSEEIEKSGLLDGNPAGGQVDAFRHCYWMALLATEIAPRKALKLGKAHEKSNYIQFKKGKMEYGILPDSISSEMDLFNNKVGVELGRKVRQGQVEKKQDHIKQLVIERIKAGELKIIKKDKQGNYLTCDGSIIDINFWKGKWGIPKCLVESYYTN